MRIARFLSVAGFFVFSCVLCGAGSNPTRESCSGLVAKSVSGHIGDAAASEGATVYSA